MCSMVTSGAPEGKGQDESGEADLVLLVPAFVCSSCGRTDLPEAGDWDPPICEECDAAINEDAIRESGAADEEW